MAHTECYTSKEKAFCDTDDEMQVCLGRHNLPGHVYVRLFSSMYEFSSSAERACLPPPSRPILFLKSHGLETECC